MPSYRLRWITDHFPEIEAYSVKYLGLRDAEDPEIFEAARMAGAVVMTKDNDFVQPHEKDPVCIDGSSRAALGDGGLGEMSDL